ncbi:hypothetical protein H6G97_23960 [Nostoc flagelliforme FACHB-838]|uniref:Uncharacterized protein n=1 Tax=Nostoc flagelliforme FACHB-838 TaxID=2692904 RepID=A0ABR8DSN2_9NOSO|nr:hypothetical protein [Nostoc flagelliforme]MBD2532472.1 hypothetical protein [Nostoc flagelliforme FACHB-838]
MRYKIILQGVGARQCRAPTGVPHVNENRYIIQGKKPDLPDIVIPASLFTRENLNS